MASYRDLLVWQRAMEIAKKVYALCSTYPKCEIYGLTSQTQRAAVSIPANIAEGHGRDTTKDFLRFLSIARGSLAELETLIRLAFEFGYIAAEQHTDIFSQFDECSRMLRGLQQSLRRKIQPEIDSTSFPSQSTRPSQPVSRHYHP